MSFSEFLLWADYEKDCGDTGIRATKKQTKKTQVLKQPVHKMHLVSFTKCLSKSDQERLRKLFDFKNKKEEYVTSFDLKT